MAMFFSRLKQVCVSRPWITAILIYILHIMHVVFLHSFFHIIWTSTFLLLLVGLLVWRKWLTPNLLFAYLSAYAWILIFVFMRHPILSWIAASFAFTPMMLLIERVKRWKRLLAYGFWTGIMIYTGGMPSAWADIRIFLGASAFFGPLLIFFILTAFLGVQMAVCMPLIGYLYHRLRAASFPVVFGLTYILVEHWMPFPWPNEPGVVLVQCPTLMQIFDLVGIETATYVFCLTSMAFYALVSPRVRAEQKPWAIKVWAMVLVAVPLIHVGYGVWKMHSLAPRPNDRKLDVALIQPCSPIYILNKDHNQKLRVADNLLNLSRQAIKADSKPPDILVWPEGAGAIQYLNPGGDDRRAFNSEYLQVIRSLQRETSVTLVLSDLKFIRPEGMGPFKGDAIKYHYLNHVSLIGRDGFVKDGYTKVIRLPFAEYLPLEEKLLELREYAVFRWIRKGLRAMFPKTRAVGQGSHRNLLFEPDDVPFAPLICYEALLGNFVREFIADGAEYMVNVANEGWLHSPLFREQSMMSAVARCVENRVPLVRATNTGISVIADARGVIHKRSGDSIQTFLRGEITPGPANAFYTRAGHFLPGWILTPLFLAIWIRAMIRDKRSAKQNTSSRNRRNLPSATSGAKKNRKRRLG